MRVSYLPKRGLVVALILLGIQGPLWGRDVTVTVMDQDLGMPLEGAEIHSFDGASYQADGDGRVTFEAPDDRPVVVRGTYPGYAPGRLVIEPGKDAFTLELLLSGILEARELVLEKSRSGESESRTGRSVALGEEEIRRTGEVGVIEDVMSSIKLLPGVGYSGLFNALPSIRGGQPGDLMAAMDGFYIENPYHWGGGFSIFDPKMVKSAQLSHGVFSVRYGHTISGLLDISTRKPSAQDLEAELGISTSAANASVSFPINRKGGVMVMGKVTYYDPVVWAAQGISRASDLEILKPVEAIAVAPYIRSTTLTAGYRFTDNLEMNFTGFFGADGVAVDYKTDGSPGGITGYGPMGSFSSAEIEGHWINYQGFGLAGLTFNPRNDMVLKLGLGGGYARFEVDGFMAYSVRDIPFNIAALPNGNPLPSTFDYDTREEIFSASTSANVQGRADFDWDLGRGFLLALGLQELYSRLGSETDFPIRTELPSPYYASTHPGFIPTADYVNFWVPYRVEAEKSHSLTSSGYALVEYGSPAGRFGAELGLRLDQLYVGGNGFSAGARPAFSPRLNLDLNLLKHKGPLESLSLTAGTGLFSSANDVFTILRAEDMDGGLKLRPNRSVTTLGGLRAEFPWDLSLAIEGYYKYVFDRTYVFTGRDSPQRHFYFDGEGRIWGFDVLLKKSQGRRLDGWIAYSFNHAMYREPGVPGDPNLFRNVTEAVSADWYYPSFHRFHVLNLILNVKPTEKFTITTRLGFASGVPLSTVMTGKQPYSVELLNVDGSSSGSYIQKWKQITARDKGNRVSFSIPLDIKFSLFNFKSNGKTHQEFYVAIENVLSLVHTPKGNSTFNPYTGEEHTGSMTASYDIPIPIPSFGFKWSY
ncbi:MAG: TonB-dependent receptor plug domain-containing protein [Treponema sp.]|jgi:hypothetical protein|nr:TonB-dependent receptor plug domain-containing protein [Treponema sp.]